MIAGVLVGIVIGAAPVMAQGNSPRDRVCREARLIGLEAYAQSFAALQDLTRPNQPPAGSAKWRAVARLIEVDETRAAFSRLARSCARVR